MILSNQDLKLVRSLRKSVRRADGQTSAVLRTIKPNKLEQKEGLILVYCSDCDQNYDIRHEFEKMQHWHRDDARIHSYSWHGGPLRCVPNSPANWIGSTLHLDSLIDISKACDMKDLKTICLCAHLPCGHANFCGLTGEQILGLLLQAKLFLRTRLAHKIQKIAAYLHVDYCGHEDSRNKEKGCKDGLDPEKKCDKKLYYVQRELLELSVPELYRLPPQKITMESMLEEFLQVSIANQTNN